MRRGRQVALAALLTISGCRCRGEKVGDKRAVACAEVPSRDTHAELDLGDGKRLIRDGVRASLQGVANETPIAITSFEGGAADVDPGAVSTIFVVGLGSLERKALAAALTTLTKRAALVVAVLGPADEVDVSRGAIADAGAHVVDGSTLRAFSMAGVEVVTVPGSDDAASLPENGRGCVVRADDVKALTQKLGPRSRPRLALAYAAPSRDSTKPSAADALTDVQAWLIAGPLDRDAPSEQLIPPGPPPLIAIPRLFAARTTSTPSVVAPGYILVRAEGQNIQLKRAEVQLKPAP